MFDWQAVAVAVIVLTALFYVGRRAWSRLKAFRARRAGETQAGCETGCGKCEEATGRPAAPAPRTVFVEISRAKPSARKPR